MKSFPQHDSEIAFHPWVTTFVHLQLLLLETFPLGRRLEGTGDFATYQSIISVVSRVTLPSQVVVQEVPVFGAWVSPCCLEPILLLEHGVDDDELILRTTEQ